MLHDSPVVSKGWFVTKCNDAISCSPNTQLLPPVARHELIVGVPIAPDVVELDVGLVLLGVGDELLDLLGDGLIAKQCEILCDFLEYILW
jgi:hypothetical protein